MHYIEGVPREQLVLFTERLDGLISEENPVRFLDAYVEQLDLDGLGFKQPAMVKGRPPYWPGLLLKIYVYGYLNRIRSSRKLEKECLKNLELIWLCRRLAPDFKTIADFRKENGRGLKNIFREFLRLCKHLELVDCRQVAIDGTKLRAQNSNNQIYKRDKIEALEKKIEARINEYLEELDRNDTQEKDEYAFLTRNLGGRLKKLRKLKDKIEFIKEVFAANPDLKEHYNTDPDSRRQRDRGRVGPGYNSQIIVDAKHKLIVANKVTNEQNDERQLSPMVEELQEVKAELALEGKTIVTTDAGYYNEHDIIETEPVDDIETYVAHPRDAKKKEKSGKPNKTKAPASGFEKDDFRYDREKDEFICPEGKVLKKYPGRYGGNKGNLKTRIYHCAECTECKSKGLCTKNKRGRHIIAAVQIKELLEYRDKVTSKRGKAFMQQRKELAEHPFGTIKETMGCRYFMQKGIEKTGSEFSFITFIYNLKRVMNILSMGELMQAIS